MKKIYLSLLLTTILYPNEELESIDVIEEATAQIVEDVSGEEIQSADLADSLQQNIADISIIRRSGVANDIILRGQTRDNINVIIDGAKIYGACVNRMDPPISHVITHAVDDIEVSEGGFDVENFGTLSGKVDVHTKKPSAGLRGELGANVGSFGYQGFSGTVEGGDKRFRFLITASTEESEQYEDGDGNDLATQLENYADSRGLKGYDYAPQYSGMDAYQKDMFMGKLFFNLTDNQELRFSYMGNRSDNVLYPSSKMDAIYDDSNLYNFEYIGKNLGSFSDRLNLQLYKSDVEHPMSTQYRVVGQEQYMTHKLTTDMRGAKLKNSKDGLTYGIDTSVRNWDGKYYMTMVKSGQSKMTGISIDDVDTQNLGFFVEKSFKVDSIEVSVGARYDDTSIETDSPEKDRDYNGFSANIFASYMLPDRVKIFGGVGKSNRVPDARELYNTKYKKLDDGTMKRIVNGNPDLDQTQNYEIDFGFEKRFDSGKIKLTTFYSMLKDYIYYNGSKMANSFENIDAKIYGFSLTGGFLVGDSISISGGLAYKKGRKDDPLTKQSDRDLADISPLKLNASLNYDYDEQGYIQLSMVASSKWDTIDSDNGEQELAGYGVLNFKTSREFDNGVEVTFGVNNLLDKTYTTTNTYKDLILMTDNSDTMLINDMGRYIYLNAKYRFGY